LAKYINSPKYSHHIDAEIFQMRGERQKRERIKIKKKLFKLRVD